MASLGKRESLRLLSAAYDYGIRHFDVARSYGYGEAEAVLGAFARSKRSNISITTKVGILPPPGYVSSAPVKHVARSLLKGVPWLRPLMRRTGRRMTRLSRFDIKSVRRSFEQSLRKLKTPYVDVLLLHDCTSDEIADSAILRFLEDCIRDGSVRWQGIAARRATVINLPDGARDRLAVAQFADSIEEDPAVFEALEPDLFPITHSILAADFKWIKRLLSTDESRAAAWAKTLTVDARNSEHLGLLIVATALSRNAHGCALYSSRNVARLQRTVSSIADARISAAQCVAFNALVSKAKISTSPR
jgi:hypothetical protein